MCKDIWILFEIFRKISCTHLNELDEEGVHILRVLGLLPELIQVLVPQDTAFAVVVLQSELRAA
jgi:hypothetical protein